MHIREGLQLGVELGKQRSTKRRYAMSESTILHRLQDDVMIITFNRPEVLNALDFPTTEAFVQAIQSCIDDDAVRAVIITGAGRGFCAGGDMKALWEHIQRGGTASHYLRDLTVLLHRATTDLRLIGKPVIAAINGVASGAGMSFAAACDIRLAGESARFKQAFTSIGLTPDSGWTALVPQIIGPAKAIELLLLDPVLDAKRALELGLVHEMVPDEMLAERAQELAARLAEGPTAGYGRAKSLLNALLFPMLASQLERERQQIVTQAGSEEFREKLAAFVARSQLH
jgi:2-(1,2-epoxy-1,2-dihydrophenyl)acetyl-CoA isomerase